MKTFRLFSMAALALVMAACSSDDNMLEQPAQQQGKIPFTATISGASAATRTVIEPGTGGAEGKLLVAWKGGEKIAVVHNGKKDEAEVTSVNPDGSAVIDGSIDASGTDGEAVVLVYPAAAVKSVVSGTTFVPNTDVSFLAPGLAQDGTLAYIGNNDLDGREGSGTLKISGSKATLAASVDMVSKTAIWELNLTTDGTTPISAKTVTMKVGTQVISGGAYAAGKGTYYLCVVPKTLTAIYGLNPTAEFTIEASDGTNDYIYTNAGALSLSTGTFYQSTLTMTKLVVGHALTSAVVGDIVGSDGKAYAAADKANLPSGVTAVAMVAYKGSASDCTNGLAIALENVSSPSLSWDNSGSNNGGKTAAEWCNAWNESTSPKKVTGGTWRLPTIIDWQNMLIGCGASGTAVEDPRNTYMKYDGLTSYLSAAGGGTLTSYYWSSTEVNVNYAMDLNFTGGSSGALFTHASKTGGCGVRACLAF